MSGSFARRLLGEHFGLGELQWVLFGIRLSICFFGHGYVTEDDYSDGCGQIARLLFGRKHSASAWSVRSLATAASGSQAADGLSLPTQSMTFPVFACAVPFQLTRYALDFCGVDSASVLSSGYVLWLLPRLHSFALSFAASFLVYRICVLMRHSNANAVVLMWCTSLEVVSMQCAPLRQNFTLFALVLLLFTILRLQQFVESTGLYIVRNALCGGIIAFGIFVHTSFFIYAVPLVCYLSLDNLFIVQRRNQNSEQKMSVLALSLKSTWLNVFALLSFFIAAFALCVLDSWIYFPGKAQFVVTPMRFLTVEFNERFGNGSLDDANKMQMNATNSETGRRPSSIWFLHIVAHMQMLFGPMAFYLLVYIWEYGLRALFTTVMFSDLLSIRGFSKKFISCNAQVSVPQKMLLCALLGCIVFPLIFFTLFSRKQKFEMLFPMLLPMCLLSAQLLFPVKVERTVRGDQLESSFEAFEEELAEERAGVGHCRSHKCGHGHHHAHHSEEDRKQQRITTRSSGVKKRTSKKSSKRKSSPTSDCRKEKESEQLLAEDFPVEWYQFQLPPMSRTLVVLWLFVCTTFCWWFALFRESAMTRALMNEDTFAKLQQYNKQRMDAFTTECLLDAGGIDTEDEVVDKVLTGLSLKNQVLFYNTPLPPLHVIYDTRLLSNFTFWHCSNNDVACLKRTLTAVMNESRMLEAATGDRYGHELIGDTALLLISPNSAQLPQVLENEVFNSRVKDAADENNTNVKSGTVQIEEEYEVELGAIEKLIAENEGENIDSGQDEAVCEAHALCQVFHRFQYVTYYSLHVSSVSTPKSLEQMNLDVILLYLSE